MNKLAWVMGVTGMATLLTALSSIQAQAASFSEVGDAGQTPSTAQVITPAQLSGAGSSLDSIAGTLTGSGDFADLFQIFLTGGQTFSAGTANAATDQAFQDEQFGIPPTVLLDPQLFLFDATGRGVYANDDSFGSLQAALLSGQPFSPQQSGTYFLAIASSDYNPVTAGGQPIFDALSTTNVGPNTQLPLSTFSGTGSDTGTYTIALSGATAVPQPVPSPSSTLGLVVLGALGAASGLKYKKSKLKLVSTRTDSK